MSELSKQALKVDNNTSFPNNNGGLITPTILRTFNENMIDSMVDEISYNVDSASWNQQIDALELFTSSVSGLNTGSLLVTASATQNVITFTKGDNSQFNVTIADTTNLTPLNQATESLQAFTSSANSRLNNLETTTASLNSSVTQLNANTASQQVSINSLNQSTSSLFGSASLSLVTASFDNGTRNLTFTKGDNQTFSVNIPDASGSAGDFVTTASFNSYTSSNDQRVSSLESESASVDISISSLNQSTASQQISIDALNTFTASQSTASLVTSINELNTFSASALTSLSNLNSATASLFNSASLTLTTASVTLNTITFTKGDGTTFPITVDTGSAGTTYINPTLNPYSGSLVLVANGFTSSSFANISASADGQVNLVFKNNNNTADTILSGSNNIFVNAGAPTAGFKRYIGNSNIYPHATSVPQISGSMGWSPNMNGNIMSNTTGIPFTFRGPVSSSLSNMNSNIVMGGTINLGTSTTLHMERAVAGVNMGGNALFNATYNLTANTTTLTNAIAVNGNLSFGAGVTLNSISSSISFNSNVNNGALTVNNRYSPIGGTSPAALSPRTNVNTLYGTGHAINFDGSNVSTTQTKQFSYNIVAGTFITGSVPDGDSSSIMATGIIGNGLIVTGSTLTSAATGPESANSGQGSMFLGRFNSLDGNKAKSAETVFAVGTGTGYNNRKTGFLVDSGSNTFVEGTLNVSGSVSFTGSAPTILSSSFSGSVITNLTDTYVDVPEVKQIVTLTSASYASLVTAGTLNPNTLYIVSGSTTSLIDTGSFATTGSNNFVGNQTITGSLILSSSAAVELNVIGTAIFTGSVRGNVVPLSITSNTASMDLNLGNYFTLTLADTATTHVTATNIQAGTSATLVITTGTNSSASLAPTLLEPSGSDYVATNGSAKKDVLSFVAVDSTNMFVVSTKNMI